MGNFPEIESVLVDVPLIDQEFYANKIKSYKVELRTIGVKFEFTDAALHITNHLMSISSYKTLEPMCLLFFN